MEAKVNQSSRYGTVTAFSGHEYVKYEWRIVPAGHEEEAARHPSLEVKQIGLDVLESLPEFSKPVELQDAGEGLEIPPTYTDPQPEPVTIPEPVADPEPAVEPVVEPVVEPAKQPRKRR
jgi:hypothetical protein